MISKIIACLWFDSTALETATFHLETCGGN